MQHGGPAGDSDERLQTVLVALLREVFAGSLIALIPTLDPHARSPRSIPMLDPHARRVHSPDG
jgi:hypothetical protein